MNVTLRMLERRLREEFGVHLAHRYVRRVVLELGEVAGTYWLACALRAFAADEVPVRLARWSFGRQHLLRLLPDDAEKLDPTAASCAASLDDPGWRVLRKWIAPTLAAERAAAERQRAARLRRRADRMAGRATVSP
jgi:hypothetical protein